MIWRSQGSSEAPQRTEWLVALGIGHPDVVHLAALAGIDPVGAQRFERAHFGVDVGDAWSSIVSSDASRVVTSAR